MSRKFCNLNKLTLALYLTFSTSLISIQGAASENSHGEGLSTSNISSPALPTDDAGDADHVIYKANYFVQYNPRHALDMVEQTPGFTLSDSNNRRGYSGAVGNLLIDGLRPSTKSQSAPDILSRIPASQVVRIELLRGAAIAGDPSGSSTLLNVVRQRSTGGGIWSIGGEYGATPDIGPRGSAAYSGRNGQIEYGVSASTLTRYREDDAYRREFDVDRIETRYRDTPEFRHQVDWSLEGDVAMPLWGGRIGGTAQFTVEEFESDRLFTDTDPSGALTSTQMADSEEDYVQGEIGINYDRPVGIWDLSLIGLINREKNTSDDITIRRSADRTIVRNTSQSRTREIGETILRGTVDTASAHHSVQFGVESALNTLEQEADFFENRGSGFQPVEIPNANVRVEEERAELFASHIWTPNEKWAVESRLAWETSTLTFTGDTDQSVDLSYSKPSLQITRSLSGNDQLRFRLYRDVGQLDFGSFVSAVSISENRIDGGNPDLKPTTSWRAELGADFRFANDAALTVTLAHHRLQDVEDQVLIVEPGPNPGDSPIRFAAPGNIGDGKRTQLDVSFLYPLDFILTGAQISVSGSRVDTEVTDPLTGRSRDISGISERSLDFEFRHDIASIRTAWGFTWEKGRESRNFRYDEIRDTETDTWITAFVETSALPNNLRLRLLIEDIGRRATTDEIRYFEPDRTGMISGFESRYLERASAPWILLELSGQF